MTSERLFNGFIHPQKLFIPPKTNFWLRLWLVGMLEYWWCWLMNVERLLHDGAAMFISVGDSTCCRRLWFLRPISAATHHCNQEDAYSSWWVLCCHPVSASDCWALSLHVTGDGSLPRSSSGSSTGILDCFGSGGWTTTPTEPGCVLGSVGSDVLLFLWLHYSVNRWLSRRPIQCI